MSHSSNTGAGGGFKLSESSVLKINKGDITQWFIDGSSSDAIPYIGLQDHNSKKLAIRSWESALESTALLEKQDHPEQLECGQREQHSIHCFSCYIMWCARVHFVLFADDIYGVWLKKAKELLQAQA